MAGRLTDRLPLPHTASDAAPIEREALAVDSPAFNHLRSVQSALAKDKPAGDREVSTRNPLIADDDTHQTLHNKSCVVNSLQVVKPVEGCEELGEDAE